MRETAYPEALDVPQDTWAQTSGATAPGVVALEHAARAGREVCGYGGCSRPWGRLLRRSGRPRLEGRWACSRDCLRALAQAAVQRELTAAAGTADVDHRHRVPLGLVLLAQGWITHPQLQQALAAQRAAGRGRIGDWLVDTCGLDREQVTRGLGVQWNRPVLNSAGFDPRRMALVMPAALRERLHLLPVRVAGGKLLYLGSPNAVDPVAANALEVMTGFPVESGLMDRDEYRQAMTALGGQTTVVCHEEIIASREALALRIAAALESARPTDARLVRLGDRCWLRLWLEPAAAAAGSLLPRTGEDMLDYVFTVPS